MSKEHPFEDINPVPNIRVGYFEKEAYLEVIDRQDKQIESFGYQITALLSRIDTLEKSQRPNDKWIPVSENLPEIATRCLIQLTDGHITIGEYFSIEKWTLIETSYSFVFPKETVVAWQPLPKPYKETENE